jgi:hypothetical protein
MNRDEAILAFMKYGPEEVYDTLFPQWEGALRAHIPDYMREGMFRWLAFGIQPGSFLTAVLENDLKGAVSQADDLNQRRLLQYVVFLHNYAPLGCWGSPAKITEWKGVLPVVENDTTPAHGAP